MNAVIFDIDGVLIDSFQAHFKSWKKMGSEYNKIVTETMFVETFGRTSREVIREWWGDTLPIYQAASMNERKEKIYRDILKENFPLMDGAMDLIDSIHQSGFAMAIGSSGPPLNVELVLKTLDPLSRFSAVVSGADVNLGKPDPQVFQVAADRLGINPKSCAVIEDSPAGIAAAVAAGMTSIALVGTVSADVLTEADLVVQSLREITPNQISELIHRQRLR